MDQQGQPRVAGQVMSSGGTAGLKIRVLSVIPGVAKGPSMVFARRQNQSLQQLGVDLKVFFLASRNNPWGIRNELARLRMEAAEFEPDIVHAHYGTMTGFVASRISGPAFVITLRGSDLNDSPQISWWHNRSSHFLTRQALRRASRILCVSQELADAIPRYRDIVRVIPTGVDLDLFRPMDRLTAREALGWPPDGKTVLFNEGGRKKGKRLDRAQAAVALAAERIGPVDLKVLNGQIQPGEVPTWVNASDCVLLASDAEGSPNIVKEALACNVPVVAVRVGDVRERLRGVSPSAVCDLNANSLGDGLIEVLSDPRDRSNGRSSVESISQEKVAEQIVCQYQEVVARHAK